MAESLEVEIHPAAKREKEERGEKGKRKKKRRSWAG